MKLKKFQKKVAKLKNYPDQNRITLPAMWLAEEAGETVHNIRQVMKNPQEDYNVNHIGEEIGDVLLTLANLADDLNLNMSEISVKAIEKLKNRVQDKHLFP